MIKTRLDGELVSILIPTYNQNLEHLKACIDSAISQTYDNIEIVVSDNHSTNGATGLIKSYGDTIKYVKPDKFLSINENFDFCARNGSGRLISFLSSDDLLLPDAIARLVDAFKSHENIAFAFGNIIHDYEIPMNYLNGQSLIRPIGSSCAVYREEIAIKFFYPWNKGSTWMAGDLIDAQIYRQTGGLSNCEYLVAGDNWLTTKLLELGGCICLDQPLALFRMRKIDHVEADCDRRLLEFADRVLIANKTSRKTAKFSSRIYDSLNLIQRLGEYPHPTVGAIKTVNGVFIKCGRKDLAGIVDYYQTKSQLYKIISKPLTGLKNFKNKVTRFLEDVCLHKYN